MNLLQQVDQAQNRLKGFETELQMYTSCDPIHFERKG